MKPQFVWNINLWGYSDSEYQWVENSVSETQCLDINSEPGVIKVNQALKKVGNSDSLVVAFVACSDGNTYAFWSNGKVYKKGTGLELVTTLWYPVMDAKEFNWYLYFVGASNLGQVAIPTTGSINWATRNETFWAFLNDDPVYHPLHDQNLILYIGDGNYVAQVDSTTGTHVFTADALDLQKQYRITTLGKFDNDLVIGATVKGDREQSEIFRWDTWSVSYSTSDPVPESSINAILSVDNSTIVQAWQNGHIYSYDGYSLSRMKRIPGDWSGNNGAIVLKNANTNFKWLPLFGISNVSGNPVKQGIYSLGSWSSAYPIVLNHEYRISENKDTEVTIGAMIALKTTILVSWWVDGIFGVDEIDWENKAPRAYLKTRKIQSGRLELSTIWASVAYRKCPNDIKLFAIENDEIIRDVPMRKDPKRKIFFSTVNAIETSSLKLQLELYSEWNSAPEIEFLTIQ